MRYHIIEEVRVAKTFNELLEVRKANPYHDERGRFTTASGAVAGGTASGFKPASTIEEAREYAKTQLGFSGIVDYGYSYIDQKTVRQVSGTLDIDTVNHINGTIADIQSRYPELKGYVTNMVCENTRTYATLLHSGRDGSATLQIGAKAYKDGHKVVEENWAEDVELGYHPKGTDASSIFWHEYGHAYAAMANAKTGNKMRAIQNSTSETQWKEAAAKKLGTDSSTYGNNVSRYASVNDGELFAEAFAAYNTSNVSNEWVNAIVEAAGADRR